MRQRDADLENEGGSAPGGVVAFPEASHQWSASNSANRNNFPTGSPNIDPVSAAKMQHYGLADEAPAEKGDVPVHPGLAPGQFRTARDANYDAPDGMTYAPGETGGKPLTANGRHRGESPEIENQPRGAYRP